MKPAAADLRAVPHGKDSARITAQTFAGKVWLRRKCGLRPGHYPAGLICSARTVWAELNAARDKGLTVETGEAVAENFADTSADPSPCAELFAVFRDIYTRNPSAALAAFAP